MTEITLIAQFYTFMIDEYIRKHISAFHEQFRDETFTCYIERCRY